MYRGRPWTMRQYAGFASAREMNERFRYLLERGLTGLSVCLRPAGRSSATTPTIDRAKAEVGRNRSVDRLRSPTWSCSSTGSGSIEVLTSMTINAPRCPARSALRTGRRERSVPIKVSSAAPSRNDISGEHIALRELHLPAAAIDVVDRRSVPPTSRAAAALEHDLDLWYHIREAGLVKVVQEPASPLVGELDRLLRGCMWRWCWSPDEFGERLSFFFDAHNDFFQEVAKFRRGPAGSGREDERPAWRYESESYAGAGASMRRPAARR